MKTYNKIIIEKEEKATDGLISRKAAIDAINALHDKPNAWLDCAVETVEALPSAQSEIFSTPSYSVSTGEPVEYVQIIRCKDCKWYDLTYPYGTIVPDAFHCKVNDRFYEASHFCGYGERRPDETD